MRLFPRTARRRLAAATAVCSLALGALVVPLATAEGGKNLKNRQKHAHSQVRHAQQDLGESSSQLRRADAALERAEASLTKARGVYQVASARLSAAQVRDAQMQQRLDEAEQRLATAQQNVAEGQRSVAQQRLQMTDAITDIYEQGDPSLLAVARLMKSRSTTDLTRQEAFNDVVVGRQEQSYDDLRAAEVLLRVREGQVEEARDAVEVQRRAAAAHLATMQKLHDEATAARNEVYRLVGTRRAARAVATRQRAHDLAQLRRAKKQEEHVRRLIMAQARKSRGGYRGPTNGLFIRPVPGSVTSPFGYRIHPIYHYWGLHDGTDFGVSCGEGMRAVADGRVISRYYSSVYGNRLYVSLGQINGKNVTAVYNHATGYRVGVGQHVRQGEVVGYVGSTGWSTGCHLHFTLLVNGVAQNPMGWLP